MCQHDFAGRRLFQHRNMLKWRLPSGDNPRVAEFQFEEQCRMFLDQLTEVLRELSHGADGRWFTPAVG
jgi:hypothetical protein